MKNLEIRKNGDEIRITSLLKEYVTEEEFVDLEVYACNEYITTPLKKQDAIQIINHLTKEFGLEHDKCDK